MSLSYLCIEMPEDDVDPRDMSHTEKLAVAIAAGLPVTFQVSPGGHIMVTPARSFDVVADEVTGRWKLSWGRSCRCWWTGRCIDGRTL